MLSHIDFSLFLAAHCFRDGSGNPLPENNFEAVVAKVNRDHHSFDSFYTKFYKVNPLV